MKMQRPRGGKIYVRKYWKIRLGKKIRAWSLESLKVCFWLYFLLEMKYNPFKQVSAALRDACLQEKQSHSCRGNNSSPGSLEVQV